ncbi:hypothetical protein LguiB_007630 [Lonicera macranthoides]
MGRRARFGGRSSCGGSGAPTTSRYDRQRYAAAGAHFSMPSSSSSSSSSISELEEEFENKYEKDSDCRFYYRLLQQGVGLGLRIQGFVLLVVGLASFWHWYFTFAEVALLGDLVVMSTDLFSYGSSQYMGDAEAVDGQCLGCDYVKEKMKDCPGVEKLRFKRESFPSQEELSKLTHQELQCRKFTEMSKRGAIYAERGGYEYNADFYTKIMADLNCDELKKKEGKEGGRRWWWW